MLGLLFIGTAVFSLQHPAPLRGAAVPGFHPFVYALDLLLPVVDFGQEDAFDPHGAARWLAYALIAAGWILATTAATGLVRAFQRN